MFPDYFVRLLSSLKSLWLLSKQTGMTEAVAQYVRLSLEKGNNLRKSRSLLFFDLGPSYKAHRCGLYSFS